MLEVGQFFNKNGALIGVLDIIKLDDKDFIFMSVEKNKKLDYKFYSVIYSKETNNHELTLVSDEELLMRLFEIEEKKSKRMDISNILPTNEN